jgi:GT2 family glycosyltransferase
MATISIVIATFHRPEALENTIRDLLSQTVLPKQIVVVDNSAREARRPPAAFLNVTGIECKYIESSKTGYVNVARNEGLKEVTADYALLLDDDMKLPRELLASFLELHAEGWDTVAGMVREDGNPISGRPGTGAPFWCLVRHRHGLSRGHTIAVPSCLVSLRRTMLAQIGFLDEAFIYNYDDYDLGLRIWLNGFTLIQDPKATAHHLKLPHGGSRKDLLGDKRTINKLTAKYYFIHKHFGRRAATIDFVSDVLWSATNHRWRLDNILRDFWSCSKAFRRHAQYGRLPGLAPHNSAFRSGK